MSRAASVIAIGLGLALMAIAALTACSSDPHPVRVCSVGATVPDAADTIGCSHDYVALGFEDDPFGTFAHTNTVNVLIARDDAGHDHVHLLDSAKWWLHFDYVYFVLEGHAMVPPTDPDYMNAHWQFNQNYMSSERRYVMGKVVQYLDSKKLVFEMAAGDNAGAPLIIKTFQEVQAVLYDGDELMYRPVANGQEQLIPQLQGHIPIITTEELFAGQTYQPVNRASGYGRLRFRKQTQLEADPVLPTDIVVLDRVPNDIPMCSGIITQEFQTPLSHIGVLSRQRHIPNMGLRDAFTNPALRAMEGQLVKLTTTSTDWAVEPGDAAAAQAWWDARRPAGTLEPRHDLTVTGIVDLSTVDESSITSVGAKAANYAGLMHMTPALPMPRPAFALPFALFDQHMTENNLWPMVDALVADAPVGEELQKRLFAIQWALYNAPMNTATRDAIVALVQGSFAGQSVRFRSSTNVEDLSQFSGAGLYTSTGANAADGPQAIENAVKNTWASVFNYAAFVERDFYRVDHRQVMMGVLIHAAFGTELANGVALTMNEFTALRPAFYVNAQIGEISVTNPTGEAEPEQILWYRYYQGLPSYYEVLARSSITHDAPVLTDAQYSELAGYLEQIHDHFRPIYCVIPGSNPQQLDPYCAIDVEWKLGKDAKLYVKQARPVRSAPGGP